MNLEEIVLEQAAKEFQMAIDQEVFRSFFNDRSMKIVWERDTEKSLILYARISYDHGPVTRTGLRDYDLDPIQEWCVHNRCGRRTSFEQFRFRNEQEVTMFLLKWS
jgi:hypothetical protein